MDETCKLSQLNIVVIQIVCKFSFITVSPQLVVIIFFERNDLHTSYTKIAKSIYSELEKSRDKSTEVN